VAFDDELGGYAGDDEADPAPRPVDPAAAERWARLKRRAGEGLDALMRRRLDEAARKAWGRGLFRRRYVVVSDLDEAAWRAYRYLGSRGQDEHHYLELGVVCHLDPNGNVIGFGVDNGADFIGLHDVSEYGLRRGLEYIQRQRQHVQRRNAPAYEHAIRPLAS
jgi:hypothetical protein